MLKQFASAVLVSRLGMPRDEAERLIGLMTIDDRSRLYGAYRDANQYRGDQQIAELAAQVARRRRVNL